MSKMRWCQSHQPLVSDESTPRYHCKHLKWDPFSSCFTLLWDVCCLKWIIASLNCDFFHAFPSACVHETNTNCPHIGNEKESRRQRHKMDEWYSFGPNPKFSSGKKNTFFSFVKWLDWVQNVQTRYLLTYCVWFCGRVCVCDPPHVFQMMAWIKCNHSSKQPASDLDLQGPRSARNNLLFLRREHCELHAKQVPKSAGEKMPPPISIRVRATCHLYPSSCRENSDPTCVPFKATAAPR